jgi:hypothetical protein
MNTITVSAIQTLTFEFEDEGSTWQETVYRIRREDGTFLADVLGEESVCNLASQFRARIRTTVRDLIQAIRTTDRALLVAEDGAEEEAPPVPAARAWGEA